MILFYVTKVSLIFQLNKYVTKIVLECSILSSRFTILSSKFTILSSRFTILSSRFTILSSRFTILSSRFTILSILLLLTFKFSILSSLNSQY